MRRSFWYLTITVVLIVGTFVAHHRRRVEPGARPRPPGRHRGAPRAGGQAAPERRARQGRRHHPQPRQRPRRRRDRGQARRRPDRGRPARREGPRQGPPPGGQDRRAAVPPGALAGSGAVACKKPSSTSEHVVDVEHGAHVVDHRGQLVDHRRGPGKSLRRPRAGRLDDVVDRPPRRRRRPPATTRDDRDDRRGEHRPPTATDRHRRRSRPRRRTSATRPWCCATATASVRYQLGPTALTGRLVDVGHRPVQRRRRERLGRRARRSTAPARRSSTSSRRRRTASRRRRTRSRSCSTAWCSRRRRSRRRASTGDVEISGNFSQGDAEDLATVLKFGSLPVQLKELTTTSVSPTLGPRPARRRSARRCDRPRARRALHARLLPAARPRGARRPRAVGHGDLHDDHLPR